jgi:hypothetical protein
MQDTAVVEVAAYTRRITCDAVQQLDFPCYSVLGLLKCVVMGDAADVSKVQAASIFRVEF